MIYLIFTPKLLFYFDAFHEVLSDKVRYLKSATSNYGVRIQYLSTAYPYPYSVLYLQIIILVLYCTSSSSSPITAAMRLSSNQNHLSRLPLEIQLLIIENLDEAFTLQTLMLAFPSITSVVYDCHFDRIIYSILSNSLSKEPMNHIYALLAAQNNFSSLVHDIGPFWRAHFCKDETTILPPQLPRSPATLSYIIRVMSATNFFATHIRYVHRRLYSFNPNDSIVHYQRALLRFQLFCEIFHQWVNSVDSVVSFPKNSYAWFKFNDELEQDEGETGITAIIKTLECGLKGGFFFSPGRADCLATAGSVGLLKMYDSVVLATDPEQMQTELNYISWFTRNVLS